MEGCEGPEPLLEVSWESPKWDTETPIVVPRAEGCLGARNSERELEE